MATAIIPGNLGRDAEYKTTQNGAEYCSFSVASETGYGDKKQTLWFDVTRWGKGAESLARILRKGSKVTVVGELSTREHDGKTYLQCNAYKVDIQGTPQGNGGGGTDAADYGNKPSDKPAGNYDDLDDDVPFLTMNANW